MNTLRKFYSSWITHLISLIVTLVPSYLLASLIPNDLGSGALLTISSVLIFILIDYIVREWVWIIFYSKYFFRGKWEGSTSYFENKVLVPQTHETIIEQNCMAIRVIPSESLSLEANGEKPFRWWNTIAMEIVPDDNGGDKVELLYQVDRNLTNLRNDITYGREVWTVTEYEKLCRVFPLSKLKKPSKVLGKFYQCVDSNKPVFQGEIEYIRK